ncbi:MAG: hypothetical protein M0036_19160 [Desulfobacteraceae bacterium]|nr:hypothetical protein [Desulfobacteraceae bacterium]
MVRLSKFENGKLVDKGLGIAALAELYGRQGFFCQPLSHRDGEAVMRAKKHQR